MTPSAPENAEPGAFFQLGEFSRRETLKYQSFEIASGEKTAGHDRSYLNELVFAGGIDGQSVLDIGCNLGYFCVEALRRNAASATGIDPDAATLRQSREIARLSGLDPDYICGDIESWDPQGRSFDTVLCLNVLHHLYDPVGAIRKMIRLARRRIVIEFAQPTVWDLFKRSGNPLLAGVSAAPIIMLGNPGKSHAMARSFLFTGKAMETLFNGHTELFEPLILRPSPFKGRQVAVANKRRIRHLLVIAGPTSSGKSTLLDRLRSDPSLRSDMGLGDTNWTIPTDNQEPLPTGPIDGLVLHYDLLRPYNRSTKTYCRDPRCDFFEVADKITVLTLMSPREVLRRRLVTSRKKSPWRSRRLSARHRALHERYGDSGFLQEWYAQWFAFCDRFAERTRENLLLIGDDSGSRIVPGSTWHEEYAKIG
jgi:2-polyprenyl-3-methyl-5-hydroxy-6-metoxy-1,4-benzoquinol methylase